MANAAVNIATKFKLTPTQVTKRVAVAQKKVLYRQGGYLRTAMQRSMRYASKRKQKSAPGEPPRAHKDNPRGALLRKLITFAVDLVKGSVIVGPPLIGGGQSIPQVLDKGGDLKPKLRKKTEFKVGQFGPMRFLGNGRFVNVKLQSQDQCDRASRLVMEENQVRLSKKTIHVAARPFTSPLLSDGGANFRKLIETNKP